MNDDVKYCFPGGRKTHGYHISAKHQHQHAGCKAERQQHIVSARAWSQKRRHSSVVCFCKRILIERKRGAEGVADKTYAGHSSGSSEIAVKGKGDEHYADAGDRGAL